MLKPSPSSSSSSSSSSSFNPSTNAHQIPPVKPRLKRTRRARDANDAQSSPGQTKRSSIYRGVTKHRWTGRYEAHLWDKHSWNQAQNKKGKQVYLGAYDEEEAAAHTYDLAALKYWGPDTLLNFPLCTYEKEYEEMQNVSREEYTVSLRRRSSGFSRGVSKYRGVAKHHHNGRWEARIGRVYGNKYLYLGTFNTQEEAARAYDLAALEHRGPNAVTNFDLSLYINRTPQTQDQIPNHHQQQQIFADQPPPQLPVFPNELPTVTINNTFPVHDPYFNYSLPSLYQDFVDNPVPISNVDGYDVTNMISNDCSGGFLDFLESDGFMDNIDCMFDECGLLESWDVNVDDASGVLDGSAKATAQAEIDLDQLINLDSSNYSLPIRICS